LTRWRDMETAELLKYRLELEKKHRGFRRDYRKDGQRNFFFSLLMRYTIVQCEFVDRELRHRHVEIPKPEPSARDEFRRRLKT